MRPSSSVARPAWRPRPAKSDPVVPAVNVGASNRRRRATTSSAHRAIRPTVLEVWFEVVGRIAEARMPLQAVGALRQGRRSAATPTTSSTSGNACIEQRGAGDAPRVERSDRLSHPARRVRAALASVRNAWPGFGPRSTAARRTIPARARSSCAARIRTARAGPHRKGKHRAAAETAHGVQRYRRRFADARRPDVRNDVLDGLRAHERGPAPARLRQIDNARSVAEVAAARRAASDTPERGTVGPGAEDRRSLCWRVGDLAHRMALRPPSARVSVSRIRLRSRPPCVPTVPTTNDPWLPRSSHPAAGASAACRR